MEQAYDVWKDKQTPEDMGNLLEAAEPTIQSALRSYAGGNQALHSRARYLATGAFKTYDPKKGTKLGTHLMTQLQPLTRHAREFERTTRIPERVVIDLYRLRQEEKKFRDTMGRDPADKELADHTGISMRRLSRLRKFGRSDIPESNLTETEEGDQAVMYPGVSRLDPSMIWMEYVHHDLAPVDQKILEWKTGYNGVQILPNNEIAKRLNVTPGAVSQRSARIAQKLSEGQMVNT